MYGFDETTGGSNYLPAGTNENVSIDSIEFSPLKEGNPSVLQFNFSKGGATFRHVEFPIDEEREREYAQRNPDTGSAEEQIRKAQQAQGERIKHILSAFMSGKKLELTASTYDEFCTKLINFIDKQYVGKLFKIKLVLNNKDYTKFPTRAIKPFIVPQDSTVVFTYDKTYDRITPLKKEDTTEFDVPEDGTTVEDIF